MEERSSAPTTISLVVAIVDRGLGERVTKLCHEAGASFSLICLGRGTARSEILEYLGLGETEKDVVLSAAEAPRARRLLDQVAKEMRLERPGHGIAFTLPVGSVSSAAMFKLMCGLGGEKE